MHTFERAATSLKNPRRHPRRILAGLLLLGAAIGTTPAALADPLVCVTVYYRVNNGPPQYVANNFCQVPTGWGPAAGEGPSCKMDSDHLDVCGSLTISGP